MGTMSRSVVFEVYTDETREHMLAEFAVISGGMSMSGKPAQPCSDADLLQRAKLHLPKCVKNVDPETCFYVMRA